MVEFAGVLLVVSLIVAAVAASGMAQQVSRAVEHSVASVLAGKSAVSGAPGSGGVPGGSGGVPGGSGGVPGVNGAPAAAAAGAAGAGAANRGPQSDRLPSGGQRPYVPPKKAHGKPQRVRGGGFEDASGNVWKWDPSGHAGPHWDVEHPDGSHTNVAPDGTVIGKDNFPNKAPGGSGGNGGGSGGDDSTGSTVKKAVGGAAILGTVGTILWWAGKAASPACGPLAPFCAIFG